MKVSDWLGIEARPQRGIMKRKPQRGKKHLVSDKEKNRLGEMFASYRQAKAKEDLCSLKYGGMMLPFHLARSTNITFSI